MTSKVAPWLEGLGEAWEAPQKRTVANKAAPTSEGVYSLRSSTSRIPRRSLSGLPSSLSRNTHSSQASTQRRRDPLAPISNNDANSVRHQPVRKAVAATRSVSEASNGSGEVFGTVQLRSKSSSPAKKQETLEWKRRLVRGELGYGDQTDLFGPSGLENIFAPSSGPDHEAPKSKNRMRWVGKSDASMPSSPPLWPSNFTAEPRSEPWQGSDSLGPVVEEEHLDNDNMREHQEDESFRSNPFDLQNSTSEPDRSHVDRPSSLAYSSPNKAFIEATEAEVIRDRTISAQTELEQEDLSPVYITKHKTVSGQVNYAALDSHLVKQFHNLNVSRRHQSPDGSDSKDHVDPQEIQSSFTEGPSRDSLPAVPDVSFPENLPTGSPFPNLGTNIEIKRGGYSQYGSFKQRPLSPSPSGVGSSLNLNATGLKKGNEGDYSRVQQERSRPTTPEGFPDMKQRSSASPLKLFAAHDTFTNNQLLRRMSQLNPDGTVNVRMARDGTADETNTRQVSSASSFGNGQLDDYAFDAEITITSATDSASEKDDSERSPASEIAPPGSKAPLRFEYKVSEGTKDCFKIKRKLSRQLGQTSEGSTMQRRTSQSHGRQEREETLSQAENLLAASAEYDHRETSGKRPPTSPFKASTPKRRRTLHASELEEGMASVNNSYHTHLQEAVSSRKRKDARHGESQNMAKPEVLAQRKILRPRNPTPSQCRRQLIQAELKEAAEEFAEHEPERLEAMMEEIESTMASDVPPAYEKQAQTLASEVAAFTMRVHKPSGELGERKRSVTTQDFLDEAMMVMNLIRAKARPQSNLGSLEESDGEAFQQSLRIDGSKPGDSILSVSRPPSRANSGWRPRTLVQPDARVVSHLRRFEENEERDDTDFIANSIASLQVDDEDNLADNVVVVDEYSNIRITGPIHTHAQDEEIDSQPVSQRSHESQIDTQTSNGTSTGRTIGTSSTKKSDNVGTLAPDAVAHLIGEQVGGMTFDKEKRCWIRVAKSPEKRHGSFLELPSTVTSDDDPFREISDLPVDEQKEMRRISSPGRTLRDVTTGNGTMPAHDQEQGIDKNQPPAESRASSQETVIPRPVTRDSSQNQPDHSSSVPSRYTAFASSQQQEKIETRATSWSDEELAKMSAYGTGRKQPLMYAAAQAAMVQNSTRHGILSQTVPEASEMTFPSETAQGEHARLHQIEEDQETLEEQSGVCEDTALDLADSDVEDIDSPKLRQTPFKAPYPPSTVYQSANRQMSLRRKTLTNRFTAEVHEQSELSLVAPLPGDRMMSLSLSVSRPVSARTQPRHRAELPSSPSKGHSSFILSELPEFTIHEEDAERPSERALAARLASHAAAEVDDRYVIAVKDLVKVLTDVNEDEPYWEDLRQLDLHERSLVSMHGLDSFCTRVQDMNVSCNALTNLSGAPATTRRLNARFNRLTTLTPWNHLLNLQYVDVSHNHLDSLDGLRDLIHLRELRADDNNITSINGVFELDGLLSLTLRRNKVQHIDFTHSQLWRLTHLDLCDNELTAVEHLENLTSLTSLDLAGSRLTYGLRVERSMPLLHSAMLRECKLENLDVSPFPNLEHLDVDDNGLSNIEGISALKALKVLSMRRQSLAEGETVSIFTQDLEARSVRLSGNSIPTLHLSNSFLSIQHLELASVGLQDLPSDFGLRMPNLRTLNLNFNSLADVRPLLNIQKLEQLNVCGNRLARLRKSIATFAKLRSLTILDLRDNPLTQGFYPNLASTLSRHTTIVRIDGNQNIEADDGRVAALDKSRYVVPLGSTDEDKQYRAHLDESTELRRRVYEILLANGCQNLTELDGLAFNRADAVAREAVWKRLVELGIIRRSSDPVAELLE